MYNDYLTEYIQEAELEMYKYFLENEMEVPEKTEDEGKPGVYKINYYYRDNLQMPKVSGPLTKSAIRDSIVEFTGGFIDSHSTQLRTSGPVHNFTFGDKETSFLYDTFNTNKKEIIEMFQSVIQETYYGKISKFIEGWILNAPHKVLLTCILIDALQNEYEDVITCCEYLWPFADYPMQYREFWRLGVDEQTMNFTIEHLGSKFKVKKVNNLLELLKYDGHISVESHAERLMTGADHVYADFMRRMHNQINNTLKNISRAYYDNINANATQHNKDAVFDDGTTVDPEGYTSNIAQIVDATINKFSTGEVNSAIAKIMADGSDANKDILINFLNQIMTAKKNKLYRFIENVITAYFQTSPTDMTVGTTEFLSFGLKLFRSIATSKDPMYQEIRQILNYWMDNIINIRQYYQREATVSGYTRAIFNYMIFMIKIYN